MNEYMYNNPAHRDTSTFDANAHTRVGQYFENAGILERDGDIIRVQQLT